MINTITMQKYSVPGSIRRCLSAFSCLSCISVLVYASPVHAATTIAIPNYSFELPSTVFVDTNVTAWEKMPKPFWWDEQAYGPWNQLIGVFMNTEPGSTNHISNMEGQQGLFLFNVPQNGLFQDYDSKDWSNSVPPHTFDATFTVGQSYTLTAGFIGGGMGMPEGASLEMALYYRDAASNAVTVVSTNVVYSVNLFRGMTNLVDLSVQTPPVTAQDPWANQHIGVRFMSTVLPTLQGGYWDLDNVRLTSSPAAGLKVAFLSDTQVELTWEGAAGSRVEFLASTNVLTPAASWVPIAQLTNHTGSISFRDTTATAPRRFYRVLETR